MATLVLFDCDGVLVDSETIGNGVLREVIAEQGLELTLSQTLSRFKGRAMSDVWQEVEAEVGRPLPEGLYDSFRERQREALVAEVREVAGAGALLGTLNAAGIAYCVASNGPHAKMRATLGATGLLPLLEGRIFSRQDVARPKPHPDLFLHAAAALQSPPGRCVVVEDSALGIAAARAAGMRAVGFSGTATADAEALRRAKAERVLTRLDQLLPLD